MAAAVEDAAPQAEHLSATRVRVELSAQWFVDYRALVPLPEPATGSGAAAAAEKEPEDDGDSDESGDDVDMATGEAERPGSPSKAAAGSRFGRYADIFRKYEGIAAGLLDPDDDGYDVNDAFIDDTELHEEERQLAASRRLKADNFFVCNPSVEEIERHRTSDSEDEEEEGAEDGSMRHSGEEADDGEPAGEGDDDEDGEGDGKGDDEDGGSVRNGDGTEKPGRRVRRPLAQDLKLPTRPFCPVAEQLVFHDVIVEGRPVKWVNENWPANPQALAAMRTVWGAGLELLQPTGDPTIQQLRLWRRVMSFMDVVWPDGKIVDPGFYHTMIQFVPMPIPQLMLWLHELRLRLMLETAKQEKDAVMTSLRSSIQHSSVREGEGAPRLLGRARGLALDARQRVVTIIVVTNALVQLLQNMRRTCQPSHSLAHRVEIGKFVQEIIDMSKGEWTDKYVRQTLSTELARRRRHETAPNISIQLADEDSFAADADGSPVSAPATSNPAPPTVGSTVSVQTAAVGSPPQPPKASASASSGNKAHSHQHHHHKSKQGHISSPAAGAAAGSEPIDLVGDDASAADEATGPLYGSSFVSVDELDWANPHFEG